MVCGDIMARPKKPTHQDLVKALMEGASAFDNAAFVQASLKYLEHRTGKPGMEALAEACWEMFYSKEVGQTAKVRIIDMFSRCLSKVPDASALERQIPGMSDEQLRESYDRVAEDIARRLDGSSEGESDDGT